MRVCKVQKIIPIGRQNIVFSCVAIETDVVLNGVIERRELSFTDAGLAQ
jgi:hypothetical protein